VDDTDIFLSAADAGGSHLIPMMAQKCSLSLWRIFEAKDSINARTEIHQAHWELASILNSLRNLEARVGIEPTHKGFADLSLTTWVPRLGWAIELLPGWIVGEVYRRQGCFGAGDRGRTGDIFLGKEALYH
jgi:hypothetical protein